MSNKEIIEVSNTLLSKVNKKRQREDDEPLFKSHILTYKDNPERTILVAMPEECETVYIYYPLSGRKDFIHNFFNEPDDILFKYLEEGYEIVEIELDTHATIWSCIEEMNVVEYKDGLQKYLEYCMQNGITIDKLKSAYDYKFYDLLTYYNSSIKEDIFLRLDAFKDKPWYDAVDLFTRIGVCKTKVEHAPDVCKALKQLGYSTRLKTKDGELYVLPAKDKKPKETEAR